MRALFSVSDRSGAVELAQRLVALGWTIISSGGTAAALRAGGVAVTEVAEVTGAPEMLDGRVKTLHPVVHGGILADRAKPAHLSDLNAAGAEPIDLVVCNLYPFMGAPSLEMIDIGGPAMLRAAAKNHAHVGVVVDPADYGAVIDELEAAGSLSTALRRRLARKAFAHCATYDGAIVAWLDAGAPEPPPPPTEPETPPANDPDRAEPEVGDSVAQGREGEPTGTAASTAEPIPAADARADDTPAALPELLFIWLRREEVLRYGENPGQLAARYRWRDTPSWWDDAFQKGGKPMSYLNVYDADAAWRLVHALGPGPAAVIVKHANPCGAAAHKNIGGAFQRALACDPVSAFGGVVALNRHVHHRLGVSLAKEFIEVIIAPGFSSGAIARLRDNRPNLRILWAYPPEPDERAALQVRSLGGSFLVQTTPDTPPGPTPDTPPGPTSDAAGHLTPDASTLPAPETVGVRATHEPAAPHLDDDMKRATIGWEVVTHRRPTRREWHDLVFAWRVVSAVTSNAIVIARDRCAVGIGAGQQNRRDAGRIAAAKAGDRAGGGAYASDAFFPFPDGLDGAIEAGCTVVVQPGGSVRDAAVIEAANRHNLAMVFTHQRTFRH